MQGKYSKKKELLVKVSISGKELKERFKFLVNELKLFHLYHFEVYVRKGS